MSLFEFLSWIFSFLFGRFRLFFKFKILNKILSRISSKREYLKQASLETSLALWR